MDERNPRWVYGPVHSRRLGRSLGIDLVPFKVCTYDCIYCQLGRTTNKTRERGHFFVERVGEVLDEIRGKLDRDPKPDYISLAGSGEPTLNDQTGPLIEGIKAMTDVPVAVLTNGSLLWMKEVRDALSRADLVLPSLDAGDERTFRLVNRPNPKIGFEKMVNGIVEFARNYNGSLWLEVFLLDGINTDPESVKKIAALAERINPEKIQLNSVSRPPAEDFAKPVGRRKLEELSTIFSGRVEVIAEYTGANHVESENGALNDSAILALLSRRPCTVEGISMGLGLKTGTVVKRLGLLFDSGAVRTVRRDNGIFYEAVRSQ